MNATKLLIVSPCYNEEEVLSETTKRLSRVLDELIQTNKIAEGYILYVDDGSKDSTWKVIEDFKEQNNYVRGLKLAQNVGHQNALWAGLEWAVEHSDVAVSIDADLQDDVNSIIPMVDYFNQGKDVVYGVRNARKSDSFFKKKTALFFYKLMMSMGVDLVYNHADFRLMSRRAMQAFIAYPERNLFLRGMAKLVGFPCAEVYYERSERFAGESKYPLIKMLNFALDGITSFSVKPLRLIVIAGVLFIFISFMAIIYAITSYVTGNAMPGWTSLLVSLWFIGGFILVAVGIIGEYVGKIYKEVKRRPRFFIEKEI